MAIWSWRETRRGSEMGCLREHSRGPNDVQLRAETCTLGARQPPDHPLAALNLLALSTAR
jgi:hypothetical protein